MKILSPDNRLSLEIELRSDSDATKCWFRVSLDGRAILAWSEIGVSGSLAPLPEVETRELTGRKGVVLAREAVVAFSNGRGVSKCLFRVADDSFCFVPLSSRIWPGIRLPASVSCGYTPSVSKDGTPGYEIWDRSDCRKLITGFRGLLFYTHGKCGAVMASCATGAFFMTAADRPVAAILPRGLRSLLARLPAVAMKRLNAQDQTAVPFVPGDAEFNAVNAFLRFDYLFDAFRTNGISVEKALTSFYHLDRKIPSRFPDAAVPVTPVHAEALTVLTDASGGEAAAGFRGEIGEYLCGARRTGTVWTVAGLTAKLRVLTLFFPFLELGVKYRAEWTLDEGADLPTNAVNPTPSVVGNGDKAMVRMNPCGGFVLKLTPFEI